MDQEILRLLIADDNDSDRLILKTILEKQGHTVFSARDGSEALKLFNQESPDLVLLDALMPVMDGFQTFYLDHVNLIMRCGLKCLKALRSSTPLALYYF